MAFRAGLLRSIGRVPDVLVIEGRISLYAGAHFSEVLLLREPLTFYRLQGQNLYQFSEGNLSSLRRKHAAPQPEQMR